MNGSVDGGRSRVYQIRLDDQIIVRHPVSLSAPPIAGLTRLPKVGFCPWRGAKPSRHVISAIPISQSESCT
jgi:hypothetical protein